MQTRNGPHSQSKSCTFGNLLVSLVSEKLCKMLNIKAGGVCLGKSWQDKCLQSTGNHEKSASGHMKEFLRCSAKYLCATNFSKQPPQLAVTR